MQKVENSILWRILSRKNVWYAYLVGRFVNIRPGRMLNLKTGQVDWSKKRLTGQTKALPLSVLVKAGSRILTEIILAVMNLLNPVEGKAWGLPEMILEKFSR